MPLYSGVCPGGHKIQFYSRIDDRDNPRACDCGEPLTRIIDAPYVRPDIPAYISPVTGEWVNSRAQRKEDLLRSNSMEWEPGLKQDIARRRVELQEKAIAPLERTIEETARALVARGDLPPL